MDKSLEQLFASLRDSDVLSNTLIIGAGDHGETPGKLYKRLGALDAPILSVPLWMHVPAHLLSPSQHLRLRDNRHRAVSLLDIVPTVREMTGYQSYTERERCAFLKHRHTADDVSHLVQGTVRRGTKSAAERLPRPHCGRLAWIAGRRRATRSSLNGRRSDRVHVQERQEELCTRVQDRR